MKLFKNLCAKEASANTVPRPICHCLDPQYEEQSWNELHLHAEKQDTNCPAWYRLIDLIHEAACDCREEFSPGREMKPGEWAQITTLPKSIGRLKAVKHLILYGSSLVRIPPEIGEMAALEQFTPYTSYRLHWFPYEITRCKKLKMSTISTRALYGNFKYRAPFPRLPQLHPILTPKRCSVCKGSFHGALPLQYWITLSVGTDAIPLLVHACSEQCIKQLPQPPEDYVQTAHQGGLQLPQPESE